MTSPRRLPTTEAAARLGVKPETLYAYVSRGLLRSERSASGSTFDAQEVARLAQSSRRAREVRPLAFVTEVTLIEDGHLYYRGVDALTLTNHPFEEVAERLWSLPGQPSEAWQAPDAQVAVVSSVLAVLPGQSSLTDRYRVAVAAAATADPFRHDVSPEAVTSVGRRVIALLSGLPALGGGERTAGSITARLWPMLGTDEPTDAGLGLLNAALVLVADHELAISTLGVRLAASFGADPYAAIGTGLGAASGLLHGAASLDAEALLHEAARLGPTGAVAARLRRRSGVAGFGLALYPDGDPRAAALLARLDGDEDRAKIVAGVLDAAAAGGLPPPNIDFGLAAVAFVAGMVTGAGEAIFTLGRVAGWVAHAMEEYAGRTSFRARATYVGRRPEARLPRAAENDDDSAPADH